MDTSQTVEQDIMDVLTEESAAYFRGDFDGLAQRWLQTDEARWIWSGPQTGTVVTVGWEDIGRKYKEGMAQLGGNFDAAEFLDRRNIQIRYSGDIAWVYYDQGLKKNDPGFRTQSDQKELKILHRVNGTWKIACIFIVAPSLMDETVAQVRLDENACVLRMSQAATVKLPEFSGLQIRGAQLRAKNSNSDVKLQSEIQTRLTLLKTGVPPSLINKDLQAVPLGTDDYSRPMHCWVYAEGGEIVVSFDTSKNTSERLDAAATTFGLSPVQRRLAAQLIEGGELQTIADASGVSVNTVKTHLRRMFEKTGTNDRASLIGALLSIERPAPSPPSLD